MQDQHIKNPPSPQHPDRFLATLEDRCNTRRPRRLPTPWAWLDGFRQEFSGTWPSLPGLFALNARRFPERWCFSAFSPREERYTYAQARELVLRLARELAAQGVAKGDRVALCGKNSPAWATTYLGILQAGAVVVPLDASLDPADLARLVQASGAKALVADQDKLKVLQDRLPAGLWLASLETGGSRPFVLELPALAAAPADLPMPAESDLAAILYTSGTTGNPKGVMLTHANLVADCFLAQYNMALSETDVFYALLPIHHSYTMLAVFIEAISVGAEIVFGRQMVFKQILGDFKAGKVTMFLAVPLLFNKLLAGILKGVRDKGPLAYGLIRSLMVASGLIKKFTGRNPGKAMFGSILAKAGLNHLRICISGGGPLAPQTFQAYNQLGLDFVQGYGLTETSPIIALNPVYRYKETSVGALVPGVELRILEPDAQGRGEILVRGPMVMQGYYQNPAATQAVMDAEGWLHTGDAGYLDRDGYVYLTGRTKNLIVTEGGKNVYPEELENRFQFYNEIDQVLIRGFVAQQDTRSEAIEALIYPTEAGFAGTDGQTDWDKVELRMADIVREVNSQLPGYEKIKRFTILRQAMEMTSTKKIRRHQVK